MARVANHFFQCRSAIVEVLQCERVEIVLATARIQDVRCEHGIERDAAQCHTLTPQPQNGGAGLIAYIRGVGQTDFNYALDPGVGVYVDDVYYATLAGSLEHMRVELQARLDTIAAQAEELRESSRRIVAAQDGERHRLARDLHDGLQQQLVVLRMQVGMLEDGDENVGRLGQQLDSVIEQLREVTHNLYPSILVDRGLTAALHSYVKSNNAELLQTINASGDYNDDIQAGPVTRIEPSPLSTRRSGPPP